MKLCNNEPLGAATIFKYISVAKRVVASAIDKDGNQLFPREWNDTFIGIPTTVKKKQNRPSISAEIMSGLAKYPILVFRVLFILLGATGARIGEMLGLEIDKHISEDCRTIKIKQKVRRGKVEPKVKTAAGDREVDLDPAVSAILKAFIGDRKSGFLFATKDGKPLYAGSLYTDHLHPALKSLGYQNRFTGDHKAGFNIFRRFRITYLRNRVPCPDGLRAFWVGHEREDEEENETGKRKKREDMGGHYDMIAEDRPFRLQKAEEFGIGFDLPSDLASLIPTVPNSDQAMIPPQAAHNEQVDWCI